MLPQVPPHEKRITFPTLLTIVRIILTPIIVSAMINQRWGVAFVLFCVAALTDLLDGLLARRWNQETLLGAALDPLADKLLVPSIFATLAFVQSPLFFIPRWFVLLVLAKELVLIIGALLLFVRCGKLDIKPTLLGKTTMVLQVGFIIWLFACYFFHWLPVKTYYTMLGLLLVAVGACLIQYILIGIRFLRSCSS